MDKGTLLDEQNLEGVGQTNNVDGNNQKEGTTPGWVSGVAKDYHEHVSKYETVTDFVKDALTWKKPELPKEDATAEEWVAYRTAMGIPEKYELEGFDDEEVQKVYFKANLTNDQAKAVHAYITAKAEEGIEAIKNANIAAREEAEKSLKNELRDKYDQTIEDARNFVRRFADESTRAYLTKTGLGNDAGLIKMFASVQRQIGGDSLFGGTSVTEIDEMKRRFPNSPEMWS